MPAVFSTSAVPLYGIFFAAVLYRKGGTRHEPVRAASFSASLVLLALALVWPLDTYADRLFWVHMIQHILLLAVVPPLLVYSAPWLRLWRPFPLAWRRATARTLASAGWAAPLRRTAHVLVRPVPAWLLFNGCLVLWHIPLLYDATLHNQLVHEGEHLAFLATGILFWLQVIDARPFYGRLGDAGRAAYVTVALVPSWVLAIVLGLSRSPLYPAYAHLPSRPGGISALADQQLAAGIMWVPGSIPYLLVLFVLVYRWLDPDPARGASARARRPVRGHP